MRSVLSGSYSALNNQGDQMDENGVYRATTRPSFDGGDVRTYQEQQKSEKFNVLNSVKKLFRGSGANSYNVDTGRLTASQSVFVLPDIHENSAFLPQQLNNTTLTSATTTTSMNYERLIRRERTKRIPGSISMEEAALLGSLPSESMDEVELKNIQLSFPSTRTLARGEGLAVEERVETNLGTVLIAIQGDRSKPAILTYHDIGLNYVSNFQAFFNFVDMRLLLQNFCIYHLNAPGQEEGAATLPETYVYPSMDSLAEQIVDVIGHYGLKRVVGLGVGAGANILCRFGLAHPEKLDALCVINCLSTQSGWIEWGYQKVNARNLKSKGMTQGVLDYLMWHHFGRVTEERNHDLVHVYRRYFESSVNPTNLGMFIDSYVKRTDLNITRELDPIRKKNVRTLKMSLLNVTGDLSPHVDDTVTFNGRLDPVNSTWMKIQDCGMVLEEQPAKLSEAFRLFLQGQGYVPCLSTKKVALNRKMSVDSGAGSSAGSCVSLNGPSRSSTQNKIEETNPVHLINLNGQENNTTAAPNSSSGSPSSSDSALGNIKDSRPSSTSFEKGIPDIQIHITENPISDVTLGANLTVPNPTC